MKKLTALLLTMVMAFALTACGPTAAPTPTLTPTPPPPASTPTPTPEPTPEVTPDPVAHQCQTKCPVCGKCIDLNCKEGGECEVKCGDGLVSHLFEAEEAVLGAGVNGMTNINNILDYPEENEPAEYVQGIMGNKGATVTFTITCDKDTVATLQARTAKTTGEVYFTDNIGISVNGEELALDVKLTAPREGYNRKRDFTWTDLGCVNLKAGENTVVFEILTEDGGRGCNIDKINLMTAEDVTLTWQYTDNGEYVAPEASYPDGYVTPSER